MEGNTDYVIITPDSLEKYRQRSNSTNMTKILYVPQKPQEQTCLACRDTAGNFFPHCLLSRDLLYRSRQLVSYPLSHNHSFSYPDYHMVTLHVPQLAPPTLCLAPDWLTKYRTCRWHTARKEHSHKAVSRSVVHLIRVYTRTFSFSVHRKCLSKSMEHLSNTSCETSQG